MRALRPAAVRQGVDRMNRMLWVWVLVPPACFAVGLLCGYVLCLLRIGGGLR